MEHNENDNIQEEMVIQPGEDEVTAETPQIVASSESIPENQADAADIADEAAKSYDTVESVTHTVRHSPFENSPYEFPHSETTSARVGPSSKGKKNRKRGLRVVSALLCLLILFSCCYLTGRIVSDRCEEQLIQIEDRYNARIQALEKQIANATGSNGNSVSGSPAPVGDGMTPSQVYAANVESVVMVYAEVSVTVFGQVTKSSSTGSGFILTESGHIVTNFHVVEDATSLSVMLYDGSQIQAELVGADSANDVALLKADAKDLRPVTIGSSDRLIVGDQVVAIGNPLGELTSTLTVGYVSAKERDVSTDGTVINMIQTDAAINSGNSGGPLFNMKGEVVGITTAKYSGTSNSGATIEGIGFAIPIDDVYDMLDDLMNYGYITGAYLGIEVSDTDSNAASYFGYPLGAYVHSVEKGSCAEEAGILAKDIIVELGGYEVGGLNDLSRALRKFDPGEETTIVVYRLGQEITLHITFDAKPQSNSTP